MKQQSSMNSGSAHFFVIISPPRCRSTYLCSLMGKHPDITCHNEVFHPDGDNLYLTKLDENAYLFDTKWRDNNVNLFISRMIEESKKQRPKAKWIGCKILLTENQMHGLNTLLSFNPRVIVLTRHNKLAAHSSIKIACETGIWVSHDHSNCQHKVTFDAKEFHEWDELQTQLEKNTYAKLREHAIDYISFEYEELTENCTINKILDFLNLPQEDLLPDMVEQNSVRILNRFNNPQEVVAFAASINQLSWVNQAEQVTQYIARKRQQIKLWKQQIIGLRQKIDITLLKKQIASVEQAINRKNDLKLENLNLEQKKELTFLKQELDAVKSLVRSWRIKVSIFLNFLKRKQTNI